MWEELFKIEAVLFKIEQEAYKNKKLELGFKIYDIRQKYGK